MTPMRLERLGLPTEATGVLAAYLSALDSGLPGGRRARALILAEVADGLACAVETAVADDVAPAVAARRAVDECGDPRRLAAQFAQQMLVGTSHRTGLALVISGPLVGVLWAAWWGAGVPDWSAKLAAAVAGVPALPLILVLTVPCAVVAASTSGWLARMTAAPSGWAYRAALLATAGCVLADATLISMALADRSLSTASTALMVAITASVVRASAAALAMKRLVRQHAAAY
jgi:hypothetical protein